MEKKSTEHINLLNAISGNGLLETELTDAINSNDTQGTELVLQNLSNEFANIYFTNYGINLNQEFENDNVRILILGMVEDINNKYINNPSSANLSCFFTAVSTFIGITQARSIWKSIVSGSYNVGTVIDALKLAGKRVATIISVGIMVYEVGNCLGWWDSATPIDMSGALPQLINIINIPIAFFLDDVSFYNSHYNNLLSYLTTTSGFNTTNATFIITTVRSNYGDPDFLGTSSVEDYFNSIN